MAMTVTCRGSPGLFNDFVLHLRNRAMRPIAVDLAKLPAQPQASHLMRPLGGFGPLIVIGTKGLGNAV